MNKTTFVFYMFFSVFFVVSCGGGNESELIKTDSTQVEINNKIDNEEETIDEGLSPEMLNTITKMKKQEELTEVDYDCICDFLFNNYDESLSEGIGYRLFEYLRGNQPNNNDFISYLSSKETSYKEKVLNELIKIMSIDIELEEYSYETLIKDFDMFKNSVSAKKAFERCMENWLE